MERASTKQILLWSGVAAAAAGILAVAAIFRLRSRSYAREGISLRIRDVQEVMLDCERKILEIESRIPVIRPSPQSA